MRNGAEHCEPDIRCMIAHIRHLCCEIGARVVGSESERAAQEYIENVFSHLGLPVWRQEIRTEAGSVLEHRVEVISPMRRIIPSYPVVFSAETPQRGLHGEVMLYDERTEKMDEIEDQIVIWPSRDYTASKWRELFRVRPKAILAVWPRLGIPPKHYSYCANSGLVSPVPTFWITWEDARDLLLGGNAKISVYLRTKRFETTTASLIAEVVGDTHPEEVVIVGGHYDTVPEVTGAMDNASGVGVVLELARLTVERGVRRTVRFAAWGGEEGGLLGSSQYVAELATNPETGCRNSEPERIIDSLDNHVFCLNIDTVGMPLGFNTCYVAGPPQAIEWMEQFERAQASGFMVTDGIDISDHLAFTEVGVPSASIVCEGPPLDLIHTTGDRIELIDDQELQHAAKFTDSLLTKLASSMDTSFLHARVSSQLSDDAKRHVQLIRHRDWTKPTPP